MKRVGHIYDRICSERNIRRAVMEASKGKRERKRVARAIQHLDETVAYIRHLLVTKTYVPSPYRVRTVKDGPSGKERVIHQPRWCPDQIIHWALMLQLQPVIMRGMYYHSCGSVPKRGSARGQRAIKKWLARDYKGTKYCLKMDITKFYPSIRHDSLKLAFRRVVKDQDCLWLIDAIIDSMDGDVGIPIGNYTSQWFANFVLQGLDHYIKQTLHTRYYCRYVDDLVLLGPNKRQLRRARVAIGDYLQALGLRIKPNWQVWLINSRDIDFLGMRFHRTRTTLRRRNARRIRRRMKKIARKGRLGLRDAQAAISYWGWIRNTNSYQFWIRYMRPYVDIRRAKKVVSQCTRFTVSSRKGA